MILAAQQVSQGRRGVFRGCGPALLRYWRASSIGPRGWGPQRGSAPLEKDTVCDALCGTPTASEPSRQFGRSAASGLANVALPLLSLLSCWAGTVAVACIHTVGTYNKKSCYKKSAGTFVVDLWAP